uniref:Uncharacterized protein n=1 Tax=Falco tinnunculus TaxID=100819 RepID=A0A8C4TPK8_FALTI
MSCGSPSKNVNHNVLICLQCSPLARWMLPRSLFSSHNQGKKKRGESVENISLASNWVRVLFL